jgi:hypothetical protein
MARSKRDKQGEDTTTLVGIFVTPTEKKMLEAAKPGNESMSEYGRNLLLRSARVTLTNQKIENEKQKT